jgi:hypothetical protein
MTQREDRRVGDPREACEDLVSFLGFDLFDSEASVPVVCEYPVCPRDEIDHRPLFCCYEQCSHRGYVPENQAVLEPSK